MLLLNKGYHPTPVLLPGKSHGWRSLVGCSQIWLCDFTFHFHTLEKEMATHSSLLALRIPRTGEPGGLPFMGSHRVGHDWSDLAAAAVIANITFNTEIKDSFSLKSGMWLLVINMVLDWTMKMPNYPHFRIQDHLCSKCKRVFRQMLWTNKTIW